MAKKLGEIKVGSVVAFSEKPKDAIWWDVLAIDGFRLTVSEFGTNYASQYIDRCYVKQIKKEAK